MLLRRYLKIIVSLVFYVASKIFWQRIQIMRGRPTGKLVVLLYHSISWDQRAALEEQMKMLVRAGHPVALAEGLHVDVSLHICVTFDDAFVETLRLALPILESKQIPATIFVPSGNLGKGAKWEAERASTINSELVASQGELPKWIRNPLFKVGSHTVSHRRLSSLTDTEALEEILDSKGSRAVTRVSGPVHRHSLRRLE